uniref:Putative terminase n=1 Tax=viral metagenome TaxID=1070528 RepID=A0A6M3KZN9_9ZZZZ
MQTEITVEPQIEDYNTIIREKLFGALGYKPWPTQQEFHDSRARFKSLFAGARYGKSKCGAMDVLPDVIKPNTRGWIVGPKYEQASKEFRYIYEELVVKMGFKPKRELNVRYSSPGPQALFFPWGSEVHTRSQENPENLLGEEIDWLLLSEGSRIDEKTYDIFLRARLGTRRGRVIVPTTPKGYNWLYKRFYLSAVDGNPLYWSKIVSVLENPLFSREEYEQAKKELPEEVFREQYDGEFVAYTGLIYKRFSRPKHVIDSFVIPAHWVRFRSIDPHPHTPCAVLWVAIDEDGTFYLYDEMFIPDLTIAEISDRIHAREGNTEVHRGLIDPNAKYIDKLRGQTMSVQMQFRQNGIQCIEANNKFESGYYRISHLLTPQPVYGDEKNLKPKMFVFKHLKETIMEFESCNWENENKDNHMLDNLKYIVNDNPMRTWKEEEIHELQEEERERQREMNPITGY